MQPAPVRTVFDVLSDFLATNPTPNEILAYRLPEALAERAAYLVERNNAGTLSPEEQQEMVDFMRADDLMTLLKAKTRLKLAGKA